jgi:predicted metal-dependent HD superfamily phosphohydrolase
MAKSELIIATEQFVTNLLTTKLDSKISYHNLNHTLSVRNAALQIASLTSVSAEEQEIIELACLLHDVGITEVYQNHEAASARIGGIFLRSKGFPEEKVTIVEACIAVTNPSARPEGILQEIVRDADYGHLGSDDYSDQLDNLRQEWKAVLGRWDEDNVWYQLNLDFIKNHEYYTPAAKMMFVAMKELNRKKLKKWVKEGRKSSNTNTKSVSRVSIVESRSSQMMFKTALRNHMDLSNLADNKANYMITINSGIMGFGIPFLIKQFEGHSEIYIPTIVMILVTCLPSLVFAILATVPMKMSGRTDIERIKSGQSNLFFFGNFYSMTYDEYRLGIQEVTSNEDNLEDSIMRDLFYLGKTLGRKYRQLRICYLIFMIGSIASVAGIAFEYFYFAPKGY